MSWGAVIVGVGSVAAAGITASNNRGNAGPPPRNGAREMAALNDNARGLADDQTQRNADWANAILGMNPAFAATQVENQRRAMEGVTSSLPLFYAAERRGTALQRRDDLRDANQLGAGYVDAYSRNSPGFARLLQELEAGPGVDDSLATTIGLDALGAGRSRLSLALEDSALRDLELGRRLSPEEERGAIQSARGAFAARGLGMSNAAIGAEILNRDSVATAREGTRRNYAAGVLDLLNRELQQTRGFQLDAANVTNAKRQADRGFLLNAQQATNRPLEMLLSNRAPASVMGSAIGAAGLGMSVGAPASIATSGPQIGSFLPTVYGYGSDVYNTNLNMMESRAIRAQNQANATSGAMLGAAGQIGAGFLQNYGTAARSTIPAAPKATYVGPGTRAQFGY